MTGTENREVKDAERNLSGALIGIDIDESKLQRAQKYILIVFLVMMAFSINALWNRYGKAIEKTDELQKEFRNSIMGVMIESNNNTKENTQALKDLTKEIESVKK